MSKCPAKNVIGSHCRKIGNFERACRSKNTLSRRRGGVHMIQEQDGELLDQTDNARWIKAGPRCLLNCTPETQTVRATT